MKQQSFDDIIRSKAERYEAAVPPGAWENIMQGKKRKRRFIFFWWLPGVLLAGNFFVIVYHHGAPSRLIGRDVLHSPAGVPSPVKTYPATGATRHPVTTVVPPVAHTASSIAYMNDKQEEGYNTTTLAPVINGTRRQVGVSIPVQSAAPGIQDSTLCPLVYDSATARQHTQPAAVTPSGWTIDISVTPFIPIQKNAALLRLERTQTGGNYQSVFIAHTIRTSMSPSLALTMAARKKINKRLDIGAGFQYARISEKVELSGTETNTGWTMVKRLKNDNGNPQLVDDTVKTITTGLRTIHAANNYTTISIPVFIQYTLTERRLFSLQLSTGAYINVARTYHNSIGGDLRPVYASGKQPGRQMTNANLDIFAGLRISTAPRNRFRLFAEPVFRYALLENNSSGMINAKYLHQAGISIGGSYLIE